ncbi:primase-helicase zinc-binding domain-containing protein [Rhizobium sp. FKY42]|uniref:DUF7146 domain-containing protein n=1 Tax=Rhizobium sp. FKY42 TaxID=2562310 RepID=UPI0010C1059B|nr:primase-helicase zinc-binding domain-containing protein [Rhizobium sp. FKY42]
MSDAVTEFVEQARAVSFAEAVDRLKVPEPRKGKPEFEGPCPRCGGNDRFAVNRKKAVWLCRGCGAGGRDGIGLAAHMLHLDVKSRAGFLEACSAVLDEPIPAGGERETEEERAARLERIDAAKAKAAQNRKDREDEGNLYREREIEKARNFWINATDCRENLRAMDYLRDYLFARTRFTVPDGVFVNLRARSAFGYYHGEDERGKPLEVHSGPAMIAPIVSSDYRIIGCHITWLDLRNGKGNSRPVLWGLSKEGAKAGKPLLPNAGRHRTPTPVDIEAGFYERLPTKKMRGHKTGGFIPLLGEPEATRWLGGEGIENVIAVAGAEGFRDDTFYFSAGDIGNLAGPADPDSAFTHESVVTRLANGGTRKRPIPGPVPKKDQAPDDALQVAAHVRELVLAADGDSERIWTASAMARAKARLARDDLDIEIWWPPEGMDWSGALSAAIAGDA